MSRHDTTKQQRQNRLRRSGAKIHGTSSRPRLCVKIGSSHIDAQIIDDDESITLAHANTLKLAETATMTQKAILVGKEIAQKAKEAKIKSVVLDRRYRRYQGRLKALADSARQEGLMI